VYYDDNLLAQKKWKKLYWIEEYLYLKKLERAFYLAKTYADGKGVKQDVKKAVELYKKELRGGNNLYNAIEIGIIYSKGGGNIKKNIPLAIKYLEKGSNAFGYFGYANLQLYRIYSDKDSKYFNIEKAINCLEKVPEDEEYSIGEAKYLLGYTYHSSGLIKKNLFKAIEYYKQAYKHGYNCEYAIDLAKRELLSEKLFNEGKAKGLSNKEARLYARKEIEKNDTNNAFREFVVKNLINQAQTKQEKLQAIKQELQTDFGEVWEYLGQEAQKALITGIYIYSAMLEVGVEYYHDFDFAPVINQFSKAYEIQLKKYFYTGFLQYLKRKKISVNEFVNPNEVRQISIVETYYKNKKRTKVGYRYFDEKNENVNPFSLGSLKYIITFDPFSKNAYFNSEINKHVLSYIKEIFKEDIFEFANYDIDVKNYLLDLANDTKTIMDRRNPSAHGAFMSIDEAEVCANYLMKVKKVIYHFVSKIKDECKGGF
jgi:TPR repeat protein